MSEPVQITIEQVREGDTIHVRRVENAGTENELVSTIQGVADGRSPTGGLCFRGHSIAYTHDSKNTITLIYRPPTRRAITLDDLKDWQKVPMGTRIELKCDIDGFPRVVAGEITRRYQSSENGWCVTVGRCPVELADIEPGTLFVIEEAKP